MSPSTENYNAKWSATIATGARKESRPVIPRPLEPLQINQFGEFKYISGGWGDASVGGRLTGG